ncbi:MAG: ABC transporter permease [Thermomicrobiales bacterium]
MSVVPHPAPSPAGAIDALLMNLRVTGATARVYVLRYASNPIQLLRAPLSPVLQLAGFVIAYNISGQTAVADSQVIGFLVIGIFMTEAWSSTVWGSGNALQSERYLGTISAVIAAPASMAAVIVGYTLGSLLAYIPSVATCAVVGILAGATFDVASPLAVGLAFTAVYICTFCIGLAFGGLFILSKHSNSLSNFLQSPIYLLTGFYVPRSVLPGWLQRVSDLIPLSHAVDALRGALLQGKNVEELANALLAAIGTSMVFLIVGIWALGKADRAIRRSGTLDIL